jgi:hypothetical protein
VETANARGYKNKEFKSLKHFRQKRNFAIIIAVYS